MSTDQFDLSNKTAVVTGGGQGIGRTIAEGLAIAGADVVPTARTHEDVEAAASAVRPHGSESFEITTDVPVQDEVEELIEETVAELGGVDVVVNNAGINPDPALGPPESIHSDGLELTLDVNLTGAFRCAQAAAKQLHEADRGSVINVASVGGLWSVSLGSIPTSRRSMVSSA